LRDSGLGGITVGVVLAIFRFVGFESAGSPRAEARNPERSIGRAILWSCGLVGLFYVFVVYTQVFGFSGTTPGFAKSTAPLPDLAELVHLPVLAPIIDLGIMCSMFACTLACVNAGPGAVHDGGGTASPHGRWRACTPATTPAPGHVDGGRAHAAGSRAVPAARRGRDRPQRVGRHGRGVRVHARLLPRRRGRGPVPALAGRAEWVDHGPRSDQRRRDALRVLGQLDTAAPGQRRVPGR